MGLSTVVPREIRKRITTWSSNATAGYIPQRSKTETQRDIRIPKFRAMLTLNSQKWGVTQMSTGGRMEKQNVMHTRSGMSVGLKKEGYFDTCSSAGELWRHYTK